MRLLDAPNRPFIREKAFFGGGVGVGGGGGFCLMSSRPKYNAPTTSYLLLPLSLSLRES